jgi:sec-independent protein translocase protein TatA
MRMPQGWEFLIIAGLVLLLFGAKRLPDAARGLGRSMRIFKAETRSLTEDVHEAIAAPEVVAAPEAVAAPATPVAVPVVQTNTEKPAQD